MVGNTNVPNMVDSSNKATAASKLEKSKPVIVHESNNGNMILADTELKFNNTLGVHIVEEKEGWVYGWASKYDVWKNYPCIPTKENEPGSSHTFKGDDSIFKLTKTKHNGRSKIRLVSEVPTSIKSDFYIGERQNKHEIFEANY